MTFEEYSSAGDVCTSDGEPISSKQADMNEAYSALASVYDKYNSESSIPLAAIAKRRGMEIIAPAPGVAFLDMAAGTGDMAMCFFEYQDIANHDAPSTATLVDLNADMLDIAKRRLGNTKWVKDGRVEFIEGNAEHISDIQNSTFDIYCCYLGMHNMVHRDRALSEAMRVLKPGGKIYVAEFNTGTWRIGKVVRRLLVQFVLYLITGTIGDRTMSLRLNRSALSFPSPPEFLQELKTAGFQVEGQGYRSIAYGLAALFSGTKPVECGSVL
ncbi:S-adenosyl-L-methionine-dependent methyltransferase [Linderina pennispora]|uniref:S-adenosyl-L-methionine-dependent methyltransferase n=1 Tax=Linderina pennispora TaxID=61395 RepID=A0A1Y1VTZ1_9FUNG|nr:S-adenosyl-L-methionine-dependent methyltransferase [Linderina pennispora]ORX64752.1 S-adenosyl-L-methionine-dependent methyltransferase [Linderina pennispora]